MSELKIIFVPITDIKIAQDRQRKAFSEKNLANLQESISSGPGLINAVTLRSNMELNTGESRLKAVTILHEIGLPVTYHGKPVPAGYIPAVIADTELDEITWLKAELHENTVRENLTWLEETAAIARIAKLEQAIINKEREKVSGADRIEEAKRKAGPLGLPTLTQTVSKEAIKATAEKLYDGKSGGYYNQVVKDSLKITDAMENNPDLAAKLSKVSTTTEAQKVMKKYVEDEQRIVLAAAQGKTFSSKMHTVLHGDCLEELKKLPVSSFDVCLTDPIYGINAQNFADSGGRMDNFDHSYDDSFENFARVLPQALKLVNMVCKEKAHLYLACDIRNYHVLKKFIEDSSTPGNEWHVPNAPFIQYKLSGGRVPYPGYTPRRSYEIWIYAYRGGKQEYKLINDVIECVADKGETHGAKKPVDLLKTFLSRSCMPGDSVIDFMAGSGSIITACHELKLRCTAIEAEAKYYGKCLERLKELK